jgi:leucyl aminopeptidase
MFGYGNVRVKFSSEKYQLTKNSSEVLAKVILIFKENIADLSGYLPDESILHATGFSANLAHVVIIPSQEGLIAAAGVGEFTTLNTDKMRRVGAAVLRAVPYAEAIELDPQGLSDACHRFYPSDYSSVGEKEVSNLLAAFAQGIALASYSFDKYRSLPISTNNHDAKAIGHNTTLHIPTGESQLVSGVTEYASITARAVTLARDLINEPAGELTPKRFAELALDIAQSTNMVSEIWDENAVKEGGLGGLLGVSSGSEEECRLVKLTYSPDHNAKDTFPKVVLVGKGITFDSGGLSLKSPEAMMTMKTDMSGAAAVLATMSVLRDLNVPLNVIGLMAMSENLPSALPTKPGDVLRTRSGKTIEVLNTDAEGRLVLADALTLASEEEPDAIIDLATLTGACVVALGESVAGVMTNDQRLMDLICRAARVSGEKFWQLPLPESYNQLIESEIADIKNVAAKPKAGALIGGLVLEKFVGDTPWAHIDMAGPARSDSDNGFLTNGGTGFGVLTLLELLKSWEVLGGKAMGAKNC